MKILHVSNSYRPFAGGVVQSIEATIEILRVHSIDARLVTFDFHHRNLLDLEWVIRIPTLFPFTYKGNTLIIPRKMHYHLKEIIESFKPDIIHVHHPFLLGYIAALYAKEKGIPVVFTHHTRYDEYHHYVPGPECAKRWIINGLVNEFCKNVDYIIAPGNDIAHVLAKRTTTPILVLPSSIQQFHMRPEMSLKRTESVIQLLTVSRFVPEKNLFFLIDACSQLEIPFEYRMVGYGPLIHDLKNYAYKKLKMDSSKILFIERPTPKELLSLYDRADIFLFSSQTETQGLVIAEAMAAGAAIVALDALWLPDMVRNGKTGFAVYSERDMAEKITQLYYDKILCSLLQHDAFESARQYFPDVCGYKLLTFYQSLMQHAS